MPAPHRSPTPTRRLRAATSSTTVVATVARTTVLALVLALALATTGCVVPAPDPTPADPVLDDSRLVVGISIHVENRNYATDADLAAHDVELGEMRAAAEAVGAVITFEISPRYLAAMETWGADFMTASVAHGHAVTLHADLGGTPLGTTEFTAQLVGLRQRLEALGFPTTTVSGVCSASEWVEAARAAGFTAVDGLVEFCLKSLDPANVPSPYTQQWLDTVCTSPVRCHGSAPSPMAAPGWLWRTSTSHDWVADDPAGAVVIVPSPGGGVRCLSEEQAGTTASGCAQDAADLVLYRELIDGYLGDLHQGHVTVLNQNWSIGLDVDPAFLDEVFAVVDGYVDAGQAVWATIPQQAATA